jgi:hypothetical protein
MVNLVKPVPCKDEALGVLLRFKANWDAHLRRSKSIGAQYKCNIEGYRLCDI